MKEFLQQAGYVLEPLSNIWSRSGYGGIAYSDGDEVEQRIADIISHAFDVTVLSTELRQHCTDWASLYHLSGARANILRPFKNVLQGDVLEIGAGCGAITRYLGECGANVLALEGSPRRAAIARSRTRDLDNVTVLAEKFDQFQCDHQFDVITLIGVLEYANLFTTGENPALSMLKRVRSLLKPEGKLIIAIENQLGLKYFAGAPEDHLGQPIVGIEGRYRKDQPQTFGRKVLAGMLEQAGFAAQEFLAPFPDYKLPVSIITEEGFLNKKFDAAAFAWQSARRDPQLPTYCNFSLELAWPQVFQNGLGLDVANSFLIIAAPNSQKLIATGELAYHYSVDRIPEYCKETVFTLGDGGDICVGYRRLDTRNGNADEANGLIRFVFPEADKYVVGRPLSLEFIGIVTNDGWTFDQLARFVRRYLLIVGTFFSPANVQECMASPYAELPGELFDAVPQNIIICEDGNASLIDKEWQLTSPIEVAYLLFRSLLLLINSITRFGLPASQAVMTRYQFIDGVFEASGLRVQERDYIRYISLEATIQQSITGRAAENYLTWGKDQPLPILNLSQALAERDGELAMLKNAVTEYVARINRFEELAEGLTATIHQYETSRSWRLTKPLRWLTAMSHGGGLLLRRAYVKTKTEGFSSALARVAQIYRNEGLLNAVFKRANVRLIGSTKSKDLIPFRNSGYTYIEPAAPSDLNEQLERMAIKPMFSIVVPVYNTPPSLLTAAIESVKKQWYPHWELILVNDASPARETCAALAKINDNRIKVLHLQENTGISGATNAGLDAAGGDYIVFMDHDDEITPDCLYELALCINREDPDFIYSDEDKLTETGEFTEPHFKPDWSPDTMMSTMFTCHVSCVRRSVQRQVGGLRSEVDGCQDWDFVLRVAEQTSRISHIPKVLYHWRIIPGSTAADIAAKSCILESSQKVRKDALARRGLAGRVEPVAQVPGYFRVAYALRGAPLISIIIPTRDNEKILRQCLDSIFSLTGYPNFEIILLDNGSRHPATLAYFESLAQNDKVRIVRHDAPFNYSELNNIGARHADGELLLFLNDDTKVLQADWLERLGGYAQLPHVGAVGAKLLYAGAKQVQHAGVVNLEAGPSHAMSRIDADAPGYFMRNLLEYNWLAVTGACLMVERIKFDEIGGFAESLPVAYNDVDFCMRLHAAGFYNVVVPAVRLIHYESVSRGDDHLDPEKLSRLKQERHQLYQRNPKYFQYDPFFNINFHPNGINFDIPKSTTN